LSREAEYCLPFAFLGLQLGLHQHALHAFRQALDQAGEHPLEDVQAIVTELEAQMAYAARELNLPVRQVERGLRRLEEGQRALNRGDFQAAIAVNRKAIKLLGDWPPPHNNLSLALFFNGQPDDAIAETRQVIASDPGNIQALSNGVRFLAWIGREDEARELWARLNKVPPQDASDRLKVAEAAACLEEDEAVYRLLEPLGKPGAEVQGLSPSLAVRAQFFRAVAEANTGRAGARRSLMELAAHDPRAKMFLTAFQEGKRGPGWAERFPYFQLDELVPSEEVEALLDLMQRGEGMKPRHFRRQVERWAARFPQLVRVAEQLIWEEQQSESGIVLLETLGTPAAYQALRRFGLSQAGTDEERMHALSVLVRAGQISEDDTLRIWIDGQWRETQIRGYEISDEETAYTQEVADLLNAGLVALQEDDEEQAEEMFRRVLALNPRAKEAYNNLGALYARRQEHDQAREMFRQAVEIDPFYAMPRCNLATYLLDEGNIAGAQAMLEPLTEASHFHPQEMAFYSYTQARILVKREEYEAARRALKTALRVYPGYQLAQDLLAWLDRVTPMLRGFEAFQEQYRKRERAKRARLQAKLTTPHPSLDEALPIYTKDMLTGMAREVIRWGSWTALRKAELIGEIIAALTDAETLAWVVAALEDEEREALRRVLTQGGRMAWDEFDAAYGNDLDESACWNYHTPETTMGRLRLRGLLAEATVDGEQRVVIPAELRPILREILVG